VSIRVSVVEDDAQARELLVGRINRSLDSQCVSDHASGEDAVDCLPKAPPDIVLMDLNLPALNGVDCVRRLDPLLLATPDMHIRRIYEELHVRSHPEAIARFARLPVRPVLITP